MQEYADEGVLTHTNELIETLEKAGIKVEVVEEGQDDANGDVDMS